MKNEIRLALLCLATAASVSAFAQNTTDSRCGTTNFDSSRNMYTIINPTPGMATQQCFITVVPKQSWTGGTPGLSTSQLVEGNYEITLSGAGGGGGGGGAGDTEHDRHQRAEAGGGSGGYGAVPFTTVRYLNPGVYRLTIGSGGQGGMAGTGGERIASGGGRGADGAPTSLSNAYSGETVAGFSGAESWNGTYPLTALGYSGASAKSGERGAQGAQGQDGGGTTGGKDADAGAQGGNGFIKLALKDPVPQAARVQAAPVQAAPAMSSSSETATTPAPAAMRPARKDRN
jgi:hypothetical protein